MPYFSKRRILRILLRTLQLRDRVDSVARGLALGIFIGITVPWGGQMTVAFFLAWLFGFNRLVAVAATNITNFVTTVPIYILSYYLGKVLLHDSRPLPHMSEFGAATHSFRAMIQLIERLGPPFLVGNFVLAVVSSAVCYWLFMRLVRHYHRRHRMPVRRVAPPPAAPDSQPKP